MTEPTNDPLERFRNVLGTQLGLAFEDERMGQLSEVFEERVATHGGDADSYLDELASEPSSEELASIARRVTVPETYFFRHKQQFDALRAILIRDHRPTAPPRLLSAGCASGEEAYSLVMMLRELWPDRAPSVVAADVNPAILDRARAARYSSWSLRDTPEPIAERWFRKDGREFVLDDEIRRSVRFVRANLAAEQPELLAPDSFDIIFCRNCLMYFTPENFRAAVRRLSRALVPEGYFFMGSAETLRGVSHDFHLRHTHDTFYYQRKSVRELSQPAPPLPSDRPPWRLPPPEVEAKAWVEEIGRAAARIAALTEEPEPASRASRRAHDRTSLDLGPALDLLHKEQFSEALAEVRALPADAASDPEAMLLEAVLLASASRFDEAERVCQRLLAVDELNAGAHYVLALCCAGGGRLERAVHYDRVATYLDPGFAMPRLHLGLMLRREGERAAAREELAQARALLEREDGARLLMFGGGFNRHALLALCDAELELTSGVPPRGARTLRGGN
ncbi:MAG TPA: CheR family methyltransferase [Polyangiaceae bacterium]|nr:CheR family methyltransferase [Polyangiaceae bacterium]